jgi:phenylalanyl-tRNA synthetase alpha chain
MSAGQRGPVPVPASRDLPQEILDLLDTKPDFSTADEYPDVSQPEIKAALDKLGSRSMIVYETIDTELVLLTPESEGICANGSHEYRVWDAVKSKGKVTIKELPVGSIPLA